MPAVWPQFLVSLELGEGYRHDVFDQGSRPARRNYNGPSSGEAAATENTVI
ncbi:hypothetical protein COCMIDRAFT_313 [Bipolaris oryzae ATCC 44560]|uniref:Uncharacterized protein n=1 Tax=Bipolaris oryzae ATCC 44560 TaxID=930090 RepID=W6ZM68_COCMI|nr:uncharacterized protein COCMIDRAFT_313 [Bipolaris oryzae ATCC 44560]EUC51093.1 hypothetical protein COCMIDRAFT_313 [Bipolaris oryzae ATCC 44560]